ncbi:MAG: phasin family protein [Zoogloeaceae bacterium]|nr:phasin family protein [Zoogloeaceae bacterium]
MSLSQEQFVAAGKANLESGLKLSVASSNIVMGAVESVSALNLSTARAAFDDGVAYVKAVGELKDPKALIALQLGLLTPSSEKAIAYAKALTDIGSKAKDELVKLYEAEVAALTAKMNSNLEGFFKNAPAGSEAAVSAVKTAIANATSAYEGATKAAKQVAEAAQASIETATAAAVENLSKGTKSVASALQVAA